MCVVVKSKSRTIISSLSATALGMGLKFIFHNCKYVTVSAKPETCEVQLFEAITGTLILTFLVQYN